MDCSLCGGLPVVLCAIVTWCLQICSGRSLLHRWTRDFFETRTSSAVALSSLITTTTVLENPNPKNRSVRNLASPEIYYDHHRNLSSIIFHYLITLITLHDCTDLVYCTATVCRCVASPSDSHHSPHRTGALNVRASESCGVALARKLREMCGAIGVRLGSAIFWRAP